ncbi:MAG: pullulanase [Verrucomicrobiota bacterium]
MNLDCPHCNQNLEMDDSWAGNTLECPNCHQSFLVPSSAPVGEAVSFPTAPRPPMHVPLQPVAAAATSVVKKRKGCGCGTFLLFLIVLGAGAFGYAVYRWQESPDQVWNRLTILAKKFIEEKFAAAPSPAPSPEETPQPTALATPRPDPVTWLTEHKEQWPREVILREAIDFPAVSNGKTVGSLKVPARVAVKVTEITRDEVGADYMGGKRRVPITATDLPVRAAAALAQAESNAREFTGSNVTRVPAHDAEKPQESIREATRDEIAKGLGAHYAHKATTFRIFAPAAKTVSVVLYDDPLGDDGRKVRPLRQESNGLWDATATGNLLGKFYTYILDGNDPQRAREVLDPYAVNSVANSTRGRITPMSAAVSAGPALDSPTDAIIYEMHVRDFTIAANSGVKSAGLYLGFTEPGTRLPDEPQIQTALDHLTELGVTHVELMPVQDFENDEASRSYNWGYITSAFFSPEGMFATNPNDDSRLRELKKLISALHARGIGVIMDVVYNHTSGKSSLLSIAPEYYYRHAPNGSLANGSGCGNEFKSESPMGRRLIIDSLKFWAKEYGFDGFRFDLMALIDQETIRQADRELRAINPNIIMFGEPWTGGTSPLTGKTDKPAIRQVPAGAFNDDFRNALKGSPDGNDPGWIQNGSKRDGLKVAMLVSDWFASPGQSINYMTCHDNLVLWDKLVASMPNADDALRIETMKLGYLALFTSQGVPFFHGGEEFARSKGGNNNSYESPDSVNEVDWSLKKEHLDLFNCVRDLIALRKAHPMFRLRTKPQVQSRVHFIDTPDHPVLMFTINGEGVPGETWKRACVILNSADSIDTEVTLPSGEWSVALDEHGAFESSPAISSKLRVRHKSGVVLFQP